MIDRLFLIGYPGDVGGACTEVWHTIKLWRQHGLEVTCVPTWKAEERWRARLSSIGVATVSMGPASFRLPLGSVVVSWCNEPFVQLAEDGRLAGCRTVWVPSMTYLLSSEKRYLSGGGRPFDRYVFQSTYQRGVIGAELESLGVTPDRFHVCHGWLDVTEFPFRPRPNRPRNGPFVVGRLSRGDPRKFSRDLWTIYGQVPRVRARVMGWNDRVGRRCGRPPAWAEVMPPGAEPVQLFLGSLHALVHPGGEAVENYPRFALEAMAAGVPVVVDNHGGVGEMLTHGMTGLLCNSPQEFADFTTRLAGDEQWRQGMIGHARRTVEEVLCNPAVAWGAWCEVFDGLEGR